MKNKNINFEKLYWKSVAAPFAIVFGFVKFVFKILLIVALSIWVGYSMWVNGLLDFLK